MSQNLQTAAQPPEPAVWDGRLDDTLQRSLNALRLECPGVVVDGHSHIVRESFRAVCTDRKTLQHMLKAALAQLPIDEGGTATTQPQQSAPSAQPAEPADLTPEKAHMILLNMSEYIHAFPDEITEQELSLHSVKFILNAVAQPQQSTPINTGGTTP